jgi:hypothetical protein
MPQLIPCLAPAAAHGPAARVVLTVPLGHAATCAIVEGVEVPEAAGEGLFFREVQRKWQGEDREG